MLRFPLIHPPLLAALGATGHGARILIADANYSHSTNISPRADLIHLNVRPGLVTVDQVLEPVLASVPVEAVTVMRPDDGSTRRAGPTGTQGRDGCLPWVRGGGVTVPRPEEGAPPAVFGRYRELLGDD